MTTQEADEKVSAPGPERTVPSQPVPPPARSRRRKLAPLVVLIVVAAIAFAAWKLFFSAPKLPDNVISLSGRLEGDDSAVSAKTTGRILEIRVREGDNVDAGNVLAILDDAQIKAREDQARAALLQSQARAQSAQAQIAVLNEQLRQGEAEVAQQEASSQLAEFDKEAYTRLAASGAVSERQGKQAASSADQQRAAVSAAKRRVDAVRMQAAQQQAEVAVAAANITQARAQLAEAAANRQDLVVKAPFSGTIATRSAEPGEVVVPGTAILTLVDLNRIYLRGFPEGQIGKVKVGQPARVYLDSNANQPVEAYVSRIDPQATFTPENTYFRDDRVKQVVGVKLQLKGAEGFAKPGMPADGEILVDGASWPTDRRKK